MLNKQQQAVIDSDSKRKAIIAGPGTGKTHTITQLIESDINRGYDVNKMTAITFTRNGASELQERLEKRINIGGMFTGTIHSFCLKILGNAISDLGWSDNFVIFDSEDKKDILTFLKDIPGIEPTGASIRRIMDNLDQYPVLKDQYRDFMCECDALDFDMIIDLTIELLGNEMLLEYVRDTYKYFYVDEFQDTYDKQLELLKIINPECLVVIGDPDQSIFEWTRAKPEYLVNIQDHFENMEMFKLERNYRSTKPIVKAANNLIAHNSMRTDKFIFTKYDGDDYQEHTFSDGHAQNQFIHELLKDGDYLDAAIICRKNKTAKYIYDYLFSEKLPVNLMTSEIALIKKVSVKGVLSIMKWAINRSNRFSLLNSAIYLQPHKRKEFFISYQRNIMNQDHFEAHILEQVPVLKFVDEITTKSNIENAYWFFNRIVEYFNIKDLYLDHKRIGKVIDIDMFSLELKDWVSKQQYRSLDTSCKEFLRQAMLWDVQEALNRDTAKINIMTVHGSKGLEFDWVIIPNCFDGEYPASKDNPEEERRLMYVAITRAKNRLFFSTPETIKTYNMTKAVIESPYLTEVKDEVCN